MINLSRRDLVTLGVVALLMIALGFAIGTAVTPTAQLPQNCTAGQILSWDGGAWTCAGTVVVDNTGNVGIGTMVPQWPLHIQSAGRITRVKVENTGTGQASLELSAGDYSWIPYVNASADKFMIWKEGNNRGRKLEIDADGNLSVGGLRIDGDKPIFFRKLHVADNNYHRWDLNRSTDDWVCGVVGFWAHGDINESGEHELMVAYAYPGPDRDWWLTVDFHGHGDNEWWDVVYMCIDKDMADFSGF